MSLNLDSFTVDDSVDKFPDGTVLNADFAGDVRVDSDNGMGQYMSAPLVNAMVKEAFKDGHFTDLKNDFAQDKTLQHVSDLKVWVMLTGSEGRVNEVMIDTARGAQPPSTTDSSSSSNSNGPLKIALTTCILSMVMIGSVSFYAYRQYQRQKEENESKASDDTSSSSGDVEDPSVFSTEYWREAWAQAASQVKPRPTQRRVRQFKRKPSSVRPKLDSIVEGEEEEEWDESSWAGGDPLESYSTWMAPNDVEADEESAIAPTMLPVELDPELDNTCSEAAEGSPQSSEGSFFKDEDPEIEIDVDLKPRMLPFRHLNKDRDVEIQMTPKSKHGNARSLMKRQDSDVENQMSVAKSKHGSGRSLTKRRDSDEITMARNRVLSKKKEKEETKPTVVEELAAVRSRVLSKEKEERAKVKEEPVVVNELAAVHQRILSKKEEKKLKEVPEVTDELTMMRNKILSKSLHGKRDPPGSKKEENVIT